LVVEVEGLGAGPLGQVEAFLPNTFDVPVYQVQRSFENKDMLKIEGYAWRNEVFMPSNFCRGARRESFID
jgi:hypothetical protein